MLLFSPLQLFPAKESWLKCKYYVLGWSIYVDNGWLEPFMSSDWRSNSTPSRHASQGHGSVFYVKCPFLTSMTFSTKFAVSANESKYT
jgi:hypothetical protein